MDPTRDSGLLGTFSLAPGPGHQVVITNNATGGTYVAADSIEFVGVGDAHAVQADAVKFVPNIGKRRSWLFCRNLLKIRTSLHPSP